MESALRVVPLLLAGAGLIVLLWEAWARRDGRRPEPRGARARERVLAGLGLLALVTYLEPLSAFSEARGVHLWDAFHYTIGAKYFDELGYDGLYDCVAVADAQEPGAAPGVSARLITDLRTNELVSASGIVARPEGCLHRFEPARWQSFRRDVALFRARFRSEDWARLSMDHGFNASPAWLLVAHPLVAHGALGWTRLRLLAALDPTLLVLALGLVAWAFEPRTAALVAIVLGTYFPAAAQWTRGSLLRWDWLAALLAGLAWCRRERPALGGAALGYAALSRMFPVFALVGVALGVVAGALRARAPRDGLRILAGAAALALVLVPASELARPGPTWSAFAHNLAKHSGVPSPNRVGLPMVLAFDPSTSLSQLDHVPAAPARAVWVRAHAADIARHRAAWAIVAALAALGVALAARAQPGWCAAALGLALVPVGPALACYYYAFVAALACLAAQKGEVAVVLLGLTTAAGVAARLPRYRIDSQYAAQSLLAAVALAFVVSAFLGRKTALPRRAGAQSASEPPLTSEASRATDASGPSDMASTGIAKPPSAKLPSTKPPEEPEAPVKEPSAPRMTPLPPLPVKTWPSNPAVPAPAVPAKDPSPNEPPTPELPRQVPI